MRSTVTFAVLACGLALNALADVHDIYPPPEQAAADIGAALKTAVVGHKRVLLDFGGNWCPSCRVFDATVHDATNKPILEANYVLVHINIGNLDKNVDIANRYGIPLKEGVPALVVLSPRGKLLYRQTTDEAIAMEHRKTEGVTQLLRQWSPGNSSSLN